MLTSKNIKLFVLIFIYLTKFFFNIRLHVKKKDTYTITIWRNMHNLLLLILKIPCKFHLYLKYNNLIKK